jgi:hypothetical protein
MIASYDVIICNVKHGKENNSFGLFLNLILFVDELIYFIFL